CYRPLRCEVITKSIVARTSQMLDVRNSIAPLFARRHIEVLRQCIPCMRMSAVPYMAAAANSNTVGDHDQAIRFYEDALRYDRRPELYYNLGLTYVDVGRVEEGVQNLI